MTEHHLTPLLILVAGLFFVCRDMLREYRDTVLQGVTFPRYRIRLPQVRFIREMRTKKNVLQTRSRIEITTNWPG